MNARYLPAALAALKMPPIFPLCISCRCRGQNLAALKIQWLLESCFASCKGVAITICCYILYLTLVHAEELQSGMLICIFLQAEAAKGAKRAQKHGAGCNVVTHVRSAVETEPDAPFVSLSQPSELPIM